MTSLQQAVIFFSYDTYMIVESNTPAHVSSKFY